MFRLQNQLTGQIQEFPNRAALMIGLEGEENRCLQLNRSATLFIYHCDKQDSVLESMEITIPPAEGKEIKELLGDFGLKKEEKNSFWSRSKAPKDQSESLPDQNISRQKGGLKNWFKDFLWLLPTLLSLASFALAYQSLYLVKHSPQENIRVEEIKSNSIDQGADVFCRYFISAYFSKNSNLEDYLSKNLSKEALEQEKGTPVSVLLEKQKENGKQIEVTYVLSLRSDDEGIISKRLKLIIEADQEAKYGYWVMQKPALSAYP